MTLHGTDAADEHEFSCALCGSTDVVFVEWVERTGVEAPDGAAEERYEIGLKCLDCGHVEEL